MKKPVQHFTQCARKWGHAVLVFAIDISLISCEEWFGDDDHNDFRGGIVADHLDTPWESAFAPDGRLFFSQRPESATRNKITCSPFAGLSIKANLK